MRMNNLKNKIIADIDSSLEILANQNIVRDDRKYSCVSYGRGKFNISYPGKDSSYSSILFDDKVNFEQIINVLLKHNQYNLLLYDKSIIQYEFLIENNSLYKQRLLFIKKHNIIWNINDLDNFENDNYDWFDDIDGIPIFLRFDYSNDATKKIFHPLSHLTISNCESCRIPTDRPIAFSQFIKFILMYFYGIEFKYGLKSPSFTGTLSDEDKEGAQYPWLTII